MKYTLRKSPVYNNNEMQYTSTDNPLHACNSLPGVFKFHDIFFLYWGSVNAQHT